MTRNRIGIGAGVVLVLALIGSLVSKPDDAAPPQAFVHTSGPSSTSTAPPKVAATAAITASPELAATPVTPTPKPTAKATPKPTPRPTPRPAPKPTKKPSSVYYKNCDAVRAAGKAPLHRGQPGYRKGLDRDGDGVACEN